jgi:hypothetical protein
MTEPNLVVPEPAVKPQPRSLIRASEACRRIGDISTTGLWRLEQEYEALRAARVYVGQLKCFVEAGFDQWLADFIGERLGQGHPLASPPARHSKRKARSRR